MEVVYASSPNVAHESMAKIESPYIGIFHLSAGRLKSLPDGTDVSGFVDEHR
jgi:hypothetical protein